MEATTKHYKILLTGDKGFIARKVKEKLEDLGHTVIGYDICDGYDLLDRTAVEEAVKQVDIVYHLAAQADLTQMTGEVDKGYAGTQINVQGTHTICYACAKYNKWLLFASTCCVYGNVLTHPEKEDFTLPNPSELYACTKYAAEWLVKGYGYNFKMPWTILRFATIYGEDMRETLGVYVFFKQDLLGHPITVHGDGSQDRTLTYVDDLVDGIVAPLTRPEAAKNQVFNLSTSERVSALTMAQDAKRITGSSSEIVFIPQRDNQTLHEDVDVSKAAELLGWKATTSWKEGLQKTHQWMKTQI